MPRAATENTARFPMLVPPAETARLMRTAALDNTTLKEFMLRNSLCAAEDVIACAERISLTEAQARFLLDLLDDPPEPNAKLRAAAKLLAAQE